jgi:hypothetical protein
MGNPAFRAHLRVCQNPSQRREPSLPLGPRLNRPIPQHFTFSPEISTFSPDIGLHYALLDSYQAKRAAQFQRRVESTLTSCGMQIIGKNVDAKSGKRDIGDIESWRKTRNTISTSNVKEPFYRYEFIFTISSTFATFTCLTCEIRRAGRKKS